MFEILDEIINVIEKLSAENNRISVNDIIMIREKLNRLKFICYTSSNPVETLIRPEERIKYVQ